MGRRRPAHRRARGGERIPAARTRARLALAAFATALAAGVGVFAVVEATRAEPIVAALAAAATVVLAAGVARGVPAVVTLGIVGLGAAWGVSSWTRGADAPAGTILAAAGIVVTAELAFAALEQAQVADEGELVARRIAGIAGRAAGALTLAAVLLGALGLHARGGLALEAVGVAAVVGLLVLLFLLAREQEARER